MKKLVAILLALIIVLGMVGCGADKDTASVYYLNFKPE